ncbi:MAG: GNAT family N-acetyltransferase [Calditrichaceae bacterium]|nr:GNAT family N-acetyltransferase [Calditrichaceae bacterium]MBN2708995.1 GNAT family N-acetyltransferase [Calditrichaceae bacterium]RQV93334.1 MAG: GNAT family N-acetyltransferase [Calditrichota bacterium]
MEKSIHKVVFRDTVCKQDEENVRNIVASTGFFSQEEIDIAVELVTERLEKGLASGYHFIFAEVENRTVGYTCFGPIPATKLSYDLYWIAVHANMRGSGIGKKLMTESEKAIAGLGGNRVYIETSGRDQYIPTRQFYLTCDYTEAAVLDDFYAPGDAKYLYLKVLE